MFLQDRVRSVNEPLNLEFWKSINGLQSALGISNTELSEIFSLTEKELFEKRTNNVAPSLRQADNIAKRFNLNLENLFNGSLDLKVIAQQHFGNASEAIPEKYKANAKSKRRTTLNILNFIESSFGYYQRSHLLQKFQLNEAVFLNPDAPIHLDLTLDIANYIYTKNKSDTVLYKMGTYSILNYKNTPITKSLVDSNDEIESYERMFCDISPKYLEKNYQWKIEKTSNSKIVLKGLPNESLKEEILNDPSKHRLGCIIRSGFIGGMSKFVGIRHKKVVKSHCVANGDPFCCYHIDISEKNN